MTTMHCFNCGSGPKATKAEFDEAVKKLSEMDRPVEHLTALVWYDEEKGEYLIFFAYPDPLWRTGWSHKATFQEAIEEIFD